MFGRLAAQGPKTAGRPLTHWRKCLTDNLRELGAKPYKGPGRKWFVYGVEVKNGRDWFTAAKNVARWHIGVEKGAKEFEKKWRCEDDDDADPPDKSEEIEVGAATQLNVTNASVTSAREESRMEMAARAARYVPD